MKRFSLFLGLALSLTGAASAKDVELSVVGIEDSISMSPFDKAWKNVSSVEVPLMAQTIAPPGGGGSVNAVAVKALMCKDEILFRLEWADASIDDYPSKAENFPDAAALQFPAVPSDWPSPFMGDRENPVIIWRWSASAQKDLDKGYQSSKAHRPNMTADLYAYAGDSTFRTGEGAGNILSNRRRESSVENLTARGFGTLTVQHEQPVQGKGVWENGRWHVVLRRDIRGTPGFWKGSRIPFAVGIWNGRERERNGMKSVSIWQTAALPGADARPKEAVVIKGRHVFQRFGCGTCHGKNAEGGVENPNAQTSPIPGLSKVREGFTKEELQNIIFNGREPARKNPAGAPPPFKMNAWKVVMDQSEADVLADYLFSLQKEVDEW